MKTARSVTRHPDTGQKFQTVAASSVERIFRQQWTRFHKALKCARKKPFPDDVHALRVTTRRLLAWHQLLTRVLAPGTRKHNCDLLRKSLQSLGDLRDTHIQKKILRGHAVEAPKRLCKWLCRREERLTRAVRECERLRSAQFRKAEKRARKELARGLEKLSPEQLSRRLHRAVHEAFLKARVRRDQARPDDTRTIHKARVALKRFRYMFDAAALSPSPGLLDQMRRQQDLMGGIQDLEILLARLEKYRRRHPEDQEALQPLAAVLTAERDKSVAAYFRAAGRLDRFRPPDLEE